MSKAKRGASAPRPFDRLYKTAKARRMTERDRALVEATENLARAIQARGISRAEFGRRVGWPASTVTRLLQGEHGCSLRSLSDAFHALGFEIVIGYREPTGAPQVQHPPRERGLKAARRAGRS